MTLSLSAILIAVFINGARISVIGVLVEYWGESMAEGFLHDVEGLFVFMACAAIMLLEMWIVSKLRRDNKPFSDTFSLEVPVIDQSLNKLPFGRARLPHYMSSLLLLCIAIVGYVLPDRLEVVPDRYAFVKFPEHIGSWQGRKELLDSIFTDRLQLDDYLSVDYQNKQGERVNMYIACYGAQRKGVSTYSP